ncbi:MAG: hypothetical protein ACNI3A_05110 [Desulfovibrio sp.]|uniref:hypothetical protein n=1 Tax=Desulfovibrio sp. 7SRBS1 TaxID=3378064 RepID=UPI003B415070
MRQNKHLITGVLYFLLCFLFYSPCSAKPQATPVLRKVLVLFDGSKGQEETKNNLFYDGFAMVFNYYGLDFDYFDIARTKVPDDTTMAKYRAVVTVLESMSVPAPSIELSWIAHQMDKGRKVLLLGLEFTTATISRLSLENKKQASLAAYEITDYCSCTPLRYAPDAPVPDMGLSTNVIGWLRPPQGLYVHLSADANRALIVPAAGNTIPTPHIHRATGTISNFHKAGQHLRFSYRGFGSGWIELAGLLPNTPYRIQLKTGEIKTSTDTKGQLRIEDMATGNMEILPL